MSKERIKELEGKINQARNDYYNSQSKINDKVYDAWVDELAELDPKNLAVIGIGFEPVSEWEKYEHKVPMGSLNKCQTHEEYIKWHEKYISKEDKVFLTQKLDGLSVSLIYENGILINASTRGSGTIGEKITPNVAKMQGVPLKLKDKINITVRGEIFLSKKNHKKYFSNYSNPRNSASGLSRSYDGNGCEKLEVLSYQIFSDELLFQTQEEQFLLLKKLGFSTPEYYILSSAKEIEDMKQKYQSSLRDKFDFELDGLVAHNNNIQKLESFGVVNNRPKGSIAVKFDSVSKEATISDIIVQTGSSGRLTPVAVFNPKINLMGVEIEKASLHNFSNINELGIDIGCTVLVCRSNDVIPYVEEVVSSTGKVFKTPTHCPNCGTNVISSGEYIQCPNTKECLPQKSGRIKNWITELNIKEWGDALIERLVESGKVKNISDLYKLSVEDLSEIDRMGKKSAKKCYDILHSNKEIPLEIFLGGLSIPLIGQSTIKLIMSAGYDNIEKMLSKTTSDLEKIQGLGPVKAKSFKDGLHDNKDLINNILQSGVCIKEKTMGKLTGYSFCFTGTMTNKRSVLEKMASDAGADIKSSVSKDLSFLVINDPEGSTSSKAINARKFGTKLISENEFLTMVNS